MMAFRGKKSFFMSQMSQVMSQSAVFHVRLGLGLALGLGLWLPVFFFSGYIF